MKKGGWVFISHSHQDIQAVRKIRNYLEKLGFEPLMFYLKCLSDENEIEELIKREIDEREWFIYADSHNARASRWVQTERDYIETLGGKKVFTINLREDLESQLADLDHIARQMKVFISYSRRDTVLQGRIREKLENKDMLVLSDEDIMLGAGWETATASSVCEAAREGFVLLLLTENFAGSAEVRREIELSLASGGKIIPVYVGKATLPFDLMESLGHTVGVRIKDAPTDEELEGVVSRILQDVEFCRGAFNDTCGFRAATTVHLPEIARIDGMTFFDCENLRCVYIPDSVIYITEDAFADFPDILIKCSKDSYAAAFCQRNGIRYAYTDGENA